ncbi:carboxylesterase/lipase family protein [Herbiconiux moechotypicola]|uniref:Carboxylic ester hydrolase n=1 Tax=Herbiconiux moechotypicola TaxID=637393 RepID=A0ABP5QCF8_9MICO|nr:carboxylesterase/lipase family protein [Herbiconiux moechotypicola]MCS5729701.1 carboxylesterase/lipase family protein [Herbiconiux moechotypicola]
MPTTDDASLLIDTTAGSVRGVLESGVRHWRGVPYAAAPVGALRFRAPQPPAVWDGVREAVAFGDAAPQHENRAVSLPEGVTQSEDCLTLNVSAPAVATRLPVMVWIHGGAYIAGSSAQPLYEPTHLVTEGDVVVVSLNYRLGALGFLDFSSLSTAEQPFDTNLGLRDIVAALHWVQQNIAAFGGDPDAVTLFGESAGGGCVTTLLTSPAASGLFHRAIAESSPATSVYGQERAARVAHQFLGLVGVDPAHPEALRELSAERLSEAAFELVGAVSAEAPGTLAIGPVVDGDLVPEHPVTAFAAGRQLPVPLIIGTNRDEASLFRLMKSPLMPITQTSVHAMFEQIALERPELDGVEERIEAAYPHFPHHRTPSEVSRDAGFRMPSIWVAAAHSRLAPTRMYRFDHSTPALRLLGIGATHGAELAYVFGNFELTRKDFSFRLGGRDAAHRVAELVRGHWLAFARTGEAPGWPLYDEAARSTLVFDHGATVVGDPDAAIREAWGDEVIGFD